jgi:hypothetical protein
VLAGACAAALLAGCGVSYELTVRNNSSRSVEARLMHDPLLSEPRTLGSARLAPGQTETLFAEGVDPLDPVDLEVRSSGDRQGVPDTIRVPSGVRTVVIESGGVTSWTGVELRLLPRGADE